jgi:carbonic anhydrase
MTNYQEIFENNRRWAAVQTDKDPSFFENLAKSQHPDYLYIGCSDSRVTAEDMMGLHPGEAFVHRNVANLVNALDHSAMSVVEYAVRHLKVKHVVVCGHYGCGGVLAAMQPKDLGKLNPWLRQIRDVYRLHQQTLDAIGSETERYNKLVELNVQEQCINVLKTTAVQTAFHEGTLLGVHGWVFDMSTGHLKDLNINFTALLRNIQQIYDLFGDRELTQ